jgi:hypothetical protein
VYNHLRKWRQKWSRVSKLKDLSGALWDSDSNAILLDQEYYLGHCKVALWFVSYVSLLFYLSKTQCFQLLD